MKSKSPSKNRHTFRKFLDAEAAAKALGVHKNSLYAYVSRGLIRAEPHPTIAKASLYLADDINTLIERKSRMRRPKMAAATALEFGLPVLKTKLTHFENDHLLYRNVDAIEFSRTATLEDTAKLLWNVQDDAVFENVIFSPASIAGWETTLTHVQKSNASNRALALLPLLATDPSAPPVYSGAPGFKSAARLVHAVSSAAVARMVPTKSPIHRFVAKGLGRPGAEDIVRRILVLLADHELNASTFAVRVVASTGARHTHCIIAGHAALSGPRHGGASDRARKFLESISSPAQAEHAVAERLEHGELIPGFGHFVYKSGDPRAKEILSHLDLDPVAAALQRSVKEQTGAEPNVDFATVAAERAVRLPEGAALILFSIARTVGWFAHIFEQRSSGNLIRPRAEYVNE